jgi:hypothetical protein
MVSRKTAGHVRYLLVIVVPLILAACAIPRPPLPYDANNPLKRVAVLPMKNDTTDVDGPQVLRKKMVQAMEHRSYAVKDTKETDQILRDQLGITLGGQLDLATAQKLGETLGVEGLLYGTLMDFDELTTGAINVKKVRGKFKLVNAMTGQTVWSRGLGVRSEMMMQSKVGAAATLAARAADARDKEVPWVTIESTTTGSDNLGKSLAVGLGAKLFSKAIGVHLDWESTELARRLTDNLPWGPGTTTTPSAPPVSAPKFAMPEVKMPEPPSFGYMDWEGKRDFSAVVFSTSLDKSRNEPFTMEIPMAISGNKVRMAMDMSKMMKGETQSPLSKMIMLNRGDKDMSYTLYPDKQKYVVHTGKEEIEEKPKIEKTKMGSEKVGKYATDKYRVKIIYKDGRVEEGLIWNARELGGMTIRSEVENRDYKVTTELRNIVMKTPPASLFEIPEGYTEAKSFMEIMGADQRTK